MPNKGYCRFCDTSAFESPELQDKFDARVAEGYGITRTNNWLRERGLQTTSVHTLYAHREHIKHPQDRIVSAVEKRQREGGIQPARTSHEEFLQSLVSIGAAKVAADPESVTVDQALKAAKIQSDTKKKGGGNNILIQLFTEGAGDARIIEGEAEELS